jgi:hypothetical protein
VDRFSPSSPFARSSVTLASPREFSFQLTLLGVDDFEVCLRMVLVERIQVARIQEMSVLPLAKKHPAAHVEFEG